MDRPISRRDFLNGVSIAIGTSLLPGCGKSGEPVPNVPFAYYPPAETGMRGSHPGSFEVAHATVQGERWSAESTGEHYDLVVVGAGISGLSAAYIYRRDVDPNARILILDNHDDFGGHAKRNEFTLDGQTFIGFGGTMQMDAPATYPAVSLQVIRELGIEFERHKEFEQDDRLAAMGLEPITFFDKETFGADFLTAPGGGLEGVPLTATGKEQLERLLADEQDYLADLSPDERRAVLESISWRDYLKEYGGFGEEVLRYIQSLSKPYWAIGADALPAWTARQTGYPGFAVEQTPEGDASDDEDLRFRFPDGNASVARLLARKLVPGGAPGNTMEDMVTARFDYSQLDKPENSTCIRLSSTVVDVHHQDGKLDGDVEVSYVNEGEGRTVTASKLIFAGYHAMLPHICPDMPEQQAAAQSDAVHAPLVYTSVLIRNWQSLADLGLRRVYCPGGFFQIMMLTHAVSMGDYEYAKSPDEPVILHLQHIPLKQGLTAPEQFRAGRQALLETSFETFEHHIRDQLGRILGPAGFDHERDIAGITVNRWSHGYAYSSDPETGEVAWDPEQWRNERRPWVEARQRVGNIVIAGTGASSNAMTESAIEEAHRAVHELKDATN